MSLSIADRLTALRLLLVPCFVVFFLLGLEAWTLVAFSVAGFTDLIDGTIARLSKQTTKFGALLDPIADKLLMGSCFILLTFANILPWWFLLLALGRDLMILVGIFYLEHSKTQFTYRALRISKFTTLIQLTTAVLGLIAWWKPTLIEVRGDFANWFGAFVIIAAVFVFLSGVQYMRLGFRILNQRAKRARGEEGQQDQALLDRAARSEILRRKINKPLR